MTELIIGGAMVYLLLDKYLPLLLAKPRPSRSWFGLRTRTDP